MQPSIVLFNKILECFLFGTLFTQMFLWNAAPPSYEAYPFEAVHAPESGAESTKDALINVMGFKPMYVFYQSANTPWMIYDFQSGNKLSA